MKMELRICFVPTHTVVEGELFLKFLGETYFFAKTNIMSVFPAPLLDPHR